jgi:F5/8 type C domain
MLTANYLYRECATLLSRRNFLSKVAHLAALPTLARSVRLSAAGKVATVRVDTTPAGELNSFIPDEALGSSMDILPYGAVDKIYTAQNTELRIAAWHWNHEGVWSDPANKKGYFTGRSEPTKFLRHSYSYPLPRRGHTRNGGADRGYSRLTDGNPGTYWKRNPYLTRRFTGEDDALHPQWVVIDMGAVQQVNALSIKWRDPYARRYAIEYWTGEDAMDKPAPGTWNRFPAGAIRDGQGSTAMLKLAPAPIPARFLRIWMTESSNSCDSHKSDDPRDCVGYAIGGLGVGTYNDAGEFMDLVHYSPDQNQTATYCSSVDPWHSASDLDLHAGDQTGFDLFFTSGITNNLPAMIPVSMLYGIPDDSAAQIAYLKKRGYPTSYVEMGEEPDGQYMLPEDCGALYLQWADAIHRVDPGLRLGGPVFEGVNEDIQVWPDAQGKTSWMGRFLDYLKTRGRLSDLAFMSFEHYPFEACGITRPDLYCEPHLVSHILDVWRQDGLPHNVPMFITESNIAASLTHPMVENLAALWLADSVGAFFAAGGSAYYHSPIQPEPLRHGCHGWGTYGNFVADDQFHIKQYTSQYFASRMINLQWVTHGEGSHRMFRATCDSKDEAGHVLVTTYALHRPDGAWSLLLVNRDPSNAHDVRIVFENSAGKPGRAFSGSVTLVTFGKEQYAWKDDGPDGHPDPDGPPVTKIVTGGPRASFDLPKASITVLRGAIEE